MILSIQYMRAIAALMIVVHHTAWKGQTYSSDPLDWFNVGRAGVDLFFIISGYIMCHTVHDKQIKISRFLLARVKRILPLYWFLTSAALLIYLYYPDKVNSSGGTTDLINSYTLLPSEGKYLINNGWTLTYEFYFYLLFSCCLILSNRYRYLIPCGVIIALVMLGGLVSNESAAFTVFTNTLLLEFVFGIVVFYFRDTIRQRPQLGIVLIALSIAALTYVNNIEITFSRVIAYGIPALVFFVGMLSLESVFKKNSTNIVARITKSLGDSSYSLYLVHPFALVLSAIILSKLGIHAIGSVFAVLLIAASVIAGHLCFVLIERNLARLVNRPQPLKQPTGVI